MTSAALASATPGIDVDEDVVLGRMRGEVGGDVPQLGVELVVGAPRRDDEVADPFERVLGEGPGAAPEGDLAEILERPDPVVAAGEDLEHEPLDGRRGPLEAAHVEALERLRALHEAADAVLAPGSGGVGGEALEDALHLGVDGAARRLEGRLVEDAVAQVARHVPERGPAPLGYGDETVEERAELRRAADRPRGGRGEAALEDRHQRLDLVLGPLAGLPDPEERLAERGALPRPLHAVVRRRPGEPVDEAGRQVRGLRVVGPEIGEEVLARRDDALGVGVPRAGLPAKEAGDVGEEAKDPLLRLEALRVGGQGGTGVHVLARHPPRVGGVDVEAEDEPADLVEDGEGPRGGRGRCARPVREDDARRGRRGLASRSGRVELDERGARTDLHVRDDEDGPDDAVERRRDRHLHLHRLESGDPLPAGDVVPRRDAEADDDGRGRRAEDAEVVPREAVRHAVDLDEVLQPLDDAEDAVADAADVEPPLVARERLDAHLALPPVELHAVVVAVEAEGAELVVRATVPELDRPPDLLPDLRAHPGRRLVELLLLDSELVVVGFDRRGEER
ncbi:MAG TPA: hypothetical protein PKA62_17400, partial [Thermoanaerobaculia bacterium]|nr:hypothetical protein [Thermoanaerobaculia bacterium]